MSADLLLLELGGVVLGLAVVARVAGRLGIPTVPLYLLAGLAFGEGGILPLVTATDFVEIGAELGLILLLFMLGLEYSAGELRAAAVRSAPAAALDVVLNFTPGFATALLLGWGLVAAAFLGGVTYVTSSGIVAKILQDFRRMGNRETPVILTLLVTEDLAMAIYLPVLAGLVLGGATLTGLLSAGLALGIVGLILFLALHIEVGVSRLVFSRSDEALLLSIVGLALLAAGAAESLRISAAVGALLAGIVLSGPAAHSARGLLAPLRDLFAAFFFAFFGLTVDPAAIPAVLGPALLLALFTAITKFWTGWWSARWAGVETLGRIRTGTTLIPRGEFSIAIAALGGAATVDPALAPTTAAYVLTLAAAGPLLMRITDAVMARRRRREREERR